jgi:hypothetical protein
MLQPSHNRAHSTRPIAHDSLTLLVAVLSQKTFQPVEKVLAARFRPVPATAENLRQGGAAMARPAQNLLPEPQSEFFNRLYC